ncbi:MAG: type II toxin-antitoxin system HicA family toxin [Chloroflexota bacterium]|nr:type II toxin-antitoxin system HicA family toxin [Chloroflexota bacterium]
MAVRQSGSHVILEHPDGTHVTVPVHQGHDLGKECCVRSCEMRI